MEGVVAILQLCHSNTESMLHCLYFCRTASSSRASSSTDASAPGGETPVQSAGADASAPGGKTPVKYGPRMARIVSMGLRNLNDCGRNEAAARLVTHGQRHTQPDEDDVRSAVMHILKLEKNDEKVRVVAVDCRPFSEDLWKLQQGPDWGHSGLHPQNVFKITESQVVCIFI